MVLINSRRWVYRFLWGVIGVILLTVLGVIGVSIYVGWNLLTPDVRPIDETPADYGLMYEDVQFQSVYDDITLNGWWLPAQQDGHQLEAEQAIIFAHGYRNNRLQPDVGVMNLAHRLTSEGYHILVFDFRRSGESEGQFVTVGQLEKYDLLAAIDYVHEEQQIPSIALMGWSMGAISAILAAHESEHAIPLLAGFNPDEVSPYHTVQQFDERKRLLIIHSTLDEAIPYTESERIWENAQYPHNVELWFTHEGGHVRSFETEQEAYVERVLQFLRPMVHK